MKITRTRRVAAALVALAATAATTCAAAQPAAAAPRITTPGHAAISWRWAPLPPPRLPAPRGVYRRPTGPYAWRWHPPIVLPPPHQPTI